MPPVGYNIFLDKYHNLGGTLYMPQGHTAYLPEYWPPQKAILQNAAPEISFPVRLVASLFNENCSTVKPVNSED